MKLKVNRSILLSSNEFAIKDNEHNPIVTIKNMMPIFGIKICVYDSDDNPQFMIDRTHDEKSNIDGFSIVESNSKIGEIKCSSGIFGRSYSADFNLGKVDISAKVSGNVQIMVNENLVVDVKIKDENGDKVYNINVLDENNVSALLCMLYAVLILSVAE